VEACDDAAVGPQVPSRLCVTGAVVDDACVAGAGAGAGAGGGAGTLPPLLYDCFGVVNHFGSMAFGHYTAFSNHAVARGAVDASGR
jgi:hypothetical protein